MIKELTYTITFPSTGKTLSGDFNLETGTTAVIGPNWSGKSFGSIELIRAMLFGKKAFRGPATDYKSLVARMVVTINGVDYTVERSGKKESLSCGDEILAVNPEAVNQKIIELLGFDLEIFDFVCAATQGEVQKLSKLPPAGRKKLIDKLLKLKPQEEVEKACKEMAKEHRTVAAALTQTLRTPVEPVRPEGYVASDKLQSRIDAAKALKIKREKLQVTPMGAPVPPTSPRPNDLEDLQKSVDFRRLLVSQRADLERVIATIPDATFTAEDLDEAEAWNNFEDELQRRGDRPTVSLEDIELFEHRWAHVKAMKSFGETEVECPSCHHHFQPGAELLAEPVLSLTELKVERRKHQNWATELVEPPAPAQILSAPLIKRGRQALAEQARKVECQAALDNLPLPGPDRSQELTEARRVEAEWVAYDRLVQAYDAHCERVAQAEAELAKLPPMTEDLDVLQAQLVQSRVYETEVDNYQRNLEAYEDTRKRIAEAEQLAVDFAAGAKAMSNTRLTVKAHLAPSLSRVASALIEQMTSGELTSVTVSEDMDIQVGTQDISTLSGAGMTIANLALRIALGQVLTARVFPVFIGDEIDSDMDMANSTATMEAISKLDQHLSQIILVTHKQVEQADHLIIHPVSGGLA